MKIKHWMTRNPITIGPDEPMVEAARLMKERGFRRLPVIERGRLIGLVTYRNILEAQPSPASSLSVHEARYLTLEMKVKDVMRKNPVTVSPDDDVFKAILEGNQKGLGCYPVVDKEALVGIITATDLFDLFIRVFGSGENYSLYLQANNKWQGPQDLLPLLTILQEQGLNLKSFATFPARQDGTKVLMLHLDKPKAQEAQRLLKDKGYIFFD